MTSTLPPLIQAFSGALGSASANLLTYPLDLVTTRVQLDPSHDGKKDGKPTAIIQVFLILRQIIRKNGLSALYDGIWTDTSATLLSNFFYFYFYSFLRSLSTRRHISFHKTRKNITIPAHKPGVVEELLLGFIAGVASRAVSTPLNIITLRLQTERSIKDETEDGHPTNKGVADVIKEVYNEQGLAGFWRGFQTTTLLSLNPSLTLALFQLFRRALNFAHMSPLRVDGHPTEVVKGAIKTPPVDPTPREAFLGAAVSNSFAVALLYPLILAKTRLQASSVSSLKQVLADTYHGKNPVVGQSKKNSNISTGSPGVQRLYQGLEAQIIKGFLNQGVTFLVKGRIEQIIVAAYFRRQRARM